MINRKLYLLLFAAVLLGGCNLIYKQSVQQGNAIEQDSVDDLSVGMSKRQVSLIMGTPAIHDPFHADRWDYIYTFRPRGNDGSQRNITLYFEDGALAKIDDKGFRNTGDPLPYIVPEPEESGEQAEPESVPAAAVVAAATVSSPEPATGDGFEAPELESEPAKIVIEPAAEVSATAREFESASALAVGYYSVQLGNFSELNNAELLRDLVVNAGHEAVIDILYDQDPLRYRVLSGRLSNRSGANTLVETLEADTGHYGFVVLIEESPD